MSLYLKAQCVSVYVSVGSTNDDEAAEVSCDVWFSFIINLLSDYTLVNK